MAGATPCVIFGAFRGCRSPASDGRNPNLVMTSPPVTATTRSLAAGVTGRAAFAARASSRGGGSEFGFTRPRKVST